MDYFLMRIGIKKKSKSAHSLTWHSKLKHTPLAILLKYSYWVFKASGQHLASTKPTFSKVHSVENKSL